MGTRALPRPTLLRPIRGALVGRALVVPQDCGRGAGLDQLVATCIRAMWAAECAPVDAALGAAKKVFACVSVANFALGTPLTKLFWGEWARQSERFGVAALRGGERCRSHLP